MSPDDPTFGEDPSLEALREALSRLYFAHRCGEDVACEVCDFADGVLHATPEPGEAPRCVNHPEGVRLHSCHACYPGAPTGDESREAVDAVGYVCPVCAYDQMEQPPDDFAICPSCGTEFDNDDFADAYAGRVLRWRELRERWIAAGRPWWSKRLQQPTPERSEAPR